MPFAAALGVVLDAAAADEVRGRLAWAPERCTTAGIMHGGALMGLADTLGGLCAFLNLPPGAGTATISSSTVFTRAVRDGEVRAVARPLHVGRSTIVVQTDLADAGGRRVAQVTQVQAVLGGGSGARQAMDARHAILFEPVVIGPKTLPNRFYQVPHASGFGSVMPRTQAAFRAIKAEGGWGGVCVEYAPIAADADETPAVGADIWDEADARALGLTAEAIHAHGALAGLELYHGGATSANGSSRAVRVAPTQAASERRWGSLAKEMTADDIARLQRDWVRAARHAADDGFDIVYVYGAHGYLLTQFCRR